MKTGKTIKTVKSMIENRDLAKLSEGAAFIRYLKKEFKDTSISIDVDYEYENFLVKNKEYRGEKFEYPHTRYRIEK